MLQSPFMSPEALMASRDEDFVGVILVFELALTETQAAAAFPPSRLFYNHLIYTGTPTTNRPMPWPVPSRKWRWMSRC